MNRSLNRSGSEGDTVEKRQDNTYHERNTRAKLDRRATGRGVNDHLRKRKYIGICLYAVFNLYKNQV